MNVVIFTFILACLMRFRLIYRRRINVKLIHYVCGYIVGASTILTYYRLSESTGRFYNIVSHISKDTAMVLGLLYWIMPALIDIIIYSSTILREFNYCTTELCILYVISNHVISELLGMIPEYNWYNVNAQSWSMSLTKLSLIIDMRQLSLILVIWIVSTKIPRLSQRWR